MERYWSLKSDHMIFNGNWFSHPYLKIDCYNKCANYWLCGCEELCAEVAIKLQVIGYLRCMIFHELAYEMRCVITFLGSDLMKC